MLAAADAKDRITVYDEWMTRAPDEQMRISGLALKSWLPAATTFSPYWRERATIHGLEPANLTTIEDLASFTTVTEGQIRGVGGPGGPALVMRPTEQQVKARASGSLVLKLAASIRAEGADGKRMALLTEYKPVHVHRAGVADDLVIAYSRSDLDRLHLCGARAASVLGLDERDVLLSAVSAGQRVDWWGLYHLAMGSSMFALHPRQAGQSVDSVVAAMSLAPVTVVAVPIDEASDLAAAMLESGQDLASVKTVLLVGPPPTAERRGVITDAWTAAGAAAKVKVRAVFAPAEGRALWAEPRTEPTGLVTYPDLEVIEVVDAVSGQTSEGSGDLTITSLGWHGSALLRFQTGWFVTSVDTQPCERTGITAPRVVGPLVKHAWQPMVDIGGGLRAPLDFRAGGLMLEHAPEAAGWRIELRGPTSRVKHDRLLVEVGGDPDEATLERLQTAFGEAAGVVPTAIRGVPEDELARSVAELGSPFADGRT